MRYLLIASLFLTAFPAFAKSQPISESLAQCSGMYFLMKELAEDRGKPKTMKKSKIAAEGFMKEAYSQAKSEGVDKPYDYVDSLVQDSIKEWDQKISGLLKMQENKEWAGYCKALGKDRGIAPFK